MTNYFIFVFNEKNYENEDLLGSVFQFPNDNIGEFKKIEDNLKKYGEIVSKVNVNDKVIWTISGNSKRKDKKTFWGNGEIVGKNNETREWNVKSLKFEKKIKIDVVINQLPEDYINLYKQSTGIINIGFKGTIQIDQFQYNFILNLIRNIIDTED